MFFNSNPESTDLQLLPVAVRKDEDIAAIADECEAAVLAAFTVVIGSVETAVSVYPSVGLVPTGAYALDSTNGVYLCLRGYDPVRANCSALLEAALLREIVGVIRWRREQWRMNPHSASESSGQGAKAISFREGKNDLFPPAFGAHLRPFDLRPPATVI